MVRLGLSSATLACAAEVAGRDVLSGEVTIVHTDLEAMSSLAWQGEVRTALAAHLEVAKEA